MSKYRILVRVLIMLAIVGVILLLFFRSKTYPEKIIIGNTVFRIETVDTAVLMAKGLSGHDPLLSDQGMLFVFSNPGKHAFWMKDMTFPIDIIWFDQNRKVIHIERSLSPTTYPNAYGSEFDSQYVLEVSAGISNNIGLKKGDQFDFLEINGRKLGI